MIWLLLLSVFSLSIIQLFSEKHPWWRMTPIAVCILFGTRVVLTAHFPLLAPTSSLLVQSGSKLWPKSAKERLAAKGIDQSRSDHDSKQSQQCHPGGSDGDFGWSHGSDDTIDARGGSLTWMSHQQECVTCPETGFGAAPVPITSQAWVSAFPIRSVRCPLSSQ